MGVGNPFGPAVSAQVQAQSMTQSLYDELTKMIGMSAASFNQNTAQHKLTQLQARQHAAQQAQSQQRWMQMAQQAVGRVLPKTFPPDWYTRARTAIDKLMAGEPLMHLDQLAKTLEELDASMEFVCKGIDVTESVRLRTALRRAIDGIELNFYDRELLAALKHQINVYQGNNCDYEIEAVSMKDGKLTLDVKIQPLRPISHVELDLTITPEKVDLVDGGGEIMPAEVANLVGQRATQDLLRKVKVHVDDINNPQTHTASEYMTLYRNAPVTPAEDEAARQKPIDWQKEIRKMFDEEVMRGLAVR